MTRAFTSDGMRTKTELNLGARDWGGTGRRCCESIWKGDWERGGESLPVEMLLGLEPPMGA